MNTSNCKKLQPSDQYSASWTISNRTRKQKEKEKRRIQADVIFFFHSYGASQADVASFKALSSPPKVEQYPHAYRWYNHIKSFEPEFSTLPGDPSKSYTTYGPESATLTSNIKGAAAKDAEEEDDDDDLFGSDDEEEDPEVVAERERRTAAYKKKKENKPKVIAKSIITMDVKPLGELPNLLLFSHPHLSINPY